MTDEFEKEALRFFEDVVSYGAENHACISVDNTIIEYFKVAIEAIRQKVVKDDGIIRDCGEENE